MSWKPEVQTAGSGDSWSGNAIRFATEQEALDYVLDLGLRWTSVMGTRVVEVDEPVNYEWVPRYGARPIIPSHPDEDTKDMA